MLHVGNVRQQNLAKFFYLTRYPQNFLNREGSE